MPADLGQTQALLLPSFGPSSGLSSGPSSGYPPVLALGAFLKNTVALVWGDHAYLFGEGRCLETPDAIRQMEQATARLLDRLPVPVAGIAHDLHPDFPSTHLAHRLAAEQSCPRFAIQHHAAHAAAGSVEHGQSGPVLALTLDGFGLGDDGEAWGGELLFFDNRTGEAQRWGHLRPLAQPGGDCAAREPWRMAAAALADLGQADSIPQRFAAFPAARLLPQMLAKGLRSPRTSSCGRLFDAACGLLDVVPVARFEGEAPMALEALAATVATPPILADSWRHRPEDSLPVGQLDLLPLLAWLAAQTARTPEQTATAAAVFHASLAAALADWVLVAQRLWLQGYGLQGHGSQQNTGHNDRSPLPVVLSGGCFFNAVLRAGVIAPLHEAGISVLPPRLLSAGDSAISVGQAWAAARRLPQTNAAQTG